MYLRFVVTRVHLWSRSCNDCFSEAHWVSQTFKSLNKQGTASAKEMYVKEKGGTTRTSSFRLKMTRARSLTQLCRHEARISLLQLKSSLLNTSNPEHKFCTTECVSWSKGFLPSKQQSRFFQFQSEAGLPWALRLRLNPFNSSDDKIQSGGADVRMLWR